MNRGVALLLLPLSGTALGLERFVWSDTYGASPPGAFGALAFELVPLLLFLGALGYLGYSGLRGLAARLADGAAGADRPKEDTGTDESA